MQRKAAKGEIGSLVAKGELAGVGLDEKHFFGGRRGLAGDLEGLKLEVDGDDGHVVLAGLGEPEQVAAGVAVAGGEVDEEEAPVFMGEPVEDGLDGFFAAKSAIEASEIFEIAA